jgi:hypothetical protein
MEFEKVRKIKGKVIKLTPKSRRSWDMIVVTGDELEPPDWSEFEGIDSEYALELKNDQSEIPEGVFKNNVDLTMITAQSVVVIGDVAFQGCTALQSVSFPKASSIGAYAFSECENLREVSFGSVVQIHDRAFQDCPSIRDINLPDTLSNIEGNPFIGCSGLHSIKVGLENPCYESRDGILYKKGGDLLISCPAGKEAGSIKSAASEIGDCAFAGCKHIGEVSLPEAGVIGWNAFYGCSSLQIVRIPKIERVCGTLDDCDGEDELAESFMDDSGLWACEKLLSIDIGNDNAHYENLGGVLHTKGLGRLLFYPPGKREPFFSSPAKHICHQTFFYCENLRGLSLPGVERIGNNTFYRCKKLACVSIPGIKEMEQGTFGRCGSLRVLELGAEPPAANGDLFSHPLDSDEQRPLLLLVPDSSRYARSVMASFPVGSEPVVFSACRDVIIRPGELLSLRNR